MKHILSTIFTLCIFLAYTTAYAATNISCAPTQCCGQILDMYGTPLPYVTVAILASPAAQHYSPASFATTDYDGIFVVDYCDTFLNNNSNGIGYLRAAAVGYVPFEITITAGTPAYGTLYEENATADNISCSKTQYREYNFSTNTSTCKTCPTHNNIAATHNYNDSGNPFYTIYNCYIPAGTQWTFSDSTGSGTERFSSGGCYYQ